MIDFNSLEKEGTVFIFLPGTPGPGQRNREECGVGRGGLDGADRHGMKDRARNELPSLEKDRTRMGAQLVILHCPREFPKRLFGSW